MRFTGKTAKIMIAQMKWIKFLTITYHYKLASSNGIASSRIRDVARKFMSFN